MNGTFRSGSFKPWQPLPIKSWIIQKRKWEETAMKNKISTANHSKLAGLLSLLAASFVYSAAPAASAQTVTSTLSIEAYIAALLEGVSDDSTKDLRPVPPKPTTVRTSKEPRAR